MKVLFVTPMRDERHAVTGAVGSVRSLAAALAKDGLAETDVLDLGPLPFEEIALPALTALLSAERGRIAAADLVHAWSAATLFLRPLFPATLVVTVGAPDGTLAPFLPSEGEAGIVLLPAEQCRAAAALAGHYRRILENHKRRDTRPWGSWESLRLMPDHKVKHIYVAPGEKLSLQYHHRRREVWTVVAGSGVITVGEEALEALPGRVFIVEKGQKHRAEGGPQGLHFIEVQTGDYLGEDDIVRLEDRYGRK